HGGTLLGHHHHSSLGLETGAGAKKSTIGRL
ncbi:uncharacterized protein METZ01_LOCUS465504, partial [marine metagenome]